MNIPFKPPVRTIGELLRRLGDIPADRVRFTPIPGTATVADLLRAENGRCELVEGTLVEKPVGWEESFLGSWLLTAINNFVLAHNLGVVTGEAGFMELPGGTVRGPDVSFISWDRMTNRTRPNEPIPELVPDLVVEVLSRSNTPGEMTHKRREYFTAGVRIVWEIDPRARAVRAYTSETAFTDLPVTGALDGGTVLPGFVLPLGQLFAELDRRG